jgi:hypothetical protein
MSSTSRAAPGVSEDWESATYSIALVDGQPARPAELSPGSKECSVLVEDDYPAIAPTGDIEAVLAVEGQRMRRAQLPITSTAVAKGLDEFAIPGEHHDAGIIDFGLTVALADVNIAVAGDGRTGRRIEDVETGPATAFTGLAKFQNCAAVGTELCHLHPFHALRRSIDHPEIAVLIDRRLVRLDKEASAEIPQRLAVGPKFDDRNAVVRFTTVNGP